MASFLEMVGATIPNLKLLFSVQNIDNPYLKHKQNYLIVTCPPQLEEMDIQLCVRFCLFLYIKTVPVIRVCLSFIRYYVYILCSYLCLISNKKSSLYIKYLKNIGRFRVLRITSQKNHNSLKPST